MVQNSQFALIIWKISIRIIILIITVVVANQTFPQGLEILQNYLGYKTPDVIWGENLVDGIVAIGFGVVFWGGILFGSLGKKVDYFFILIFIVLGLWDFWTTSTVTTAMYLGLIGAAVVGNVIGFVLKVLRQKFLPKLEV
jgi:hypothetical protein